MADDKTTKTPEQPVTDSGPGKETPPAPPKEPEKVSVSPEPEKKTEPEVKNPQVSVYNFAEIMKEKKAEERAAAPGVEKPDPAKTEKPEKQPEAPKKAEEKPKEPEQPKRRGRPPKADKDKAATPKPKAPAQKPEKVVKKEPEKKTAPTVQAAPAPKESEKPKDAPRRGKEQIVYIKLNELHAFKNHPFEVRDDEEMRAMVSSVKDKGVTQPAIVRPREDGGYEIVSGHRRQKASELAGYADMPCIVRNLTDDEAITQMVEDNLNQREEILPSERAKALKMQLEAMEIMAEGIAPMKTKFETNKEKIRNAINDIAERAKSFEEFQRLLKAEYGIQVKDHRERFSYLTSDRQKYISARKLGSHYDREYLLQLFEENALAAEQNQAQWVPDDPITILFIKSDLRLVVDLQNCIKAQQSRAYAQKVKISNLQQMAKTVAYIQEHGYDTQEKLQDTTDTIQSKMAKARSDAKLTEAKLKKVNEQIHYLGQYLSIKSVYADFLKSTNKKDFRQNHADEIAKYEEALQFLKQNSPDGKLPTMKDLRSEKELLVQQKDTQYETYQYFKDYHRELQTVCSNVASILNQPSTQKRTKDEHTL